MNEKENTPTNKEIETASEAIKQKKPKGSPCINCDRIMKGVFGEVQCGVCARKYGGIGEQIKRRDRQRER